MFNSQSLKSYGW